MKKWLILITILMLPMFAYAEQCRDIIDMGENCTLVTKELTCGNYNYSIYNSTGANVENGNLTNLNSSIYYFNWTLSSIRQGYVIQLCDGATAQIQVGKGDDNNMILFGLMLLPLILGIFFLIGANILGERHTALKIGLFLASIPTFFSAGHIGLLGLIRFYPTMTELQDWLGTITFVTSIFFWVIVAYFGLYLIAFLTLWVLEYSKGKQKKEEELEF